MMETFYAWIGFVIILVFLGALISLFLMWYGAGLSGIGKANFWRSLCAALITSVTTYLIALAALMAGPPGITLYGLGFGLFLSFFILKWIYKTSFLKALGPWIFFLISQALAIFLGIQLFIGSLKDLMAIV